MTIYSEINSRVLRFSGQQELGSQYGNGECWTLAEAAVVAAGAQGSRPQTPHFGPLAPYVWGDLETNLNNIQPGDIVQFINYHVRWETFVRVGSEPAPGRIQGGPRIRSQTHHTAIVRAVIVPGQLLQVYEQNVSFQQGVITSEARRIQINPLALVSLTAPTVSRTTDSGDTEMETSRFTVLGHPVLRFYHPHPVPQPRAHPHPHGRAHPHAHPHPHAHHHPHR